ncbi:MAG: deoxyribose-phosphate aldolase [Clostridia bacterium]|nr:deoxyribose-phosphate aldolase [Clostridia bacterium]
MKLNDINRYMDHTLLKPDATPEQIRQLCEEAIKYDFYSVCVNSSYVSLAEAYLDGSDVEIACVVGFPLGAMTSEAKGFETIDAIEHGANEIDMVINVGRLKAGDTDYVQNDIAMVCQLAHDRNALVKVIIETCLLSDEEKELACKLAVKAGADYLKTSTGFAGGGATVEDVALMKKAVGDHVGVKASGGIRDYETAVKMIEAGATRLGTSASVNIIKELD